MDFRTIIEDQTFGVRVSALILQDGKLLTCRYRGKQLVIGGAVRVGETTREAVKREIQEELGVECQVHNLAYVVENQFIENFQTYHMMEFHYIVEVMEEVPTHLKEQKERWENDDFELQWIPLKELSATTIRPRFLAAALPQWNGQIEHIVVDARQEE